MLSFLYKIYFIKFDNDFIDQFYKRLIIRLFNIFIPVYFYLSHYFLKNGLNSQKKTKPELIVSLTSFPVRIKKVWLTIETILRQREKPDKILLWLYSGEFNGKQTMPKNLLKLEKRGLEIRFCDENLMPHKKYYYTMLEFPNANIITVDDDLFYPSDLIEKLLKYHKEYPESIISTITRQIRVKQNKFMPYREWDYLKVNSEPDYRNLPIGAGGTLYPAGALHKDVFKIEILRKIALKADDLWLKIMCIRNRTKVASIAGEYPRFFIPVIQKNKRPLMNINIGKGQNDKVFNNLLEYYQIPLTVFNEK